HDELLHHKRRYIIDNLKQVVLDAGYNIHYVSYYNFVLFPLIVLALWGQNLLKKGGNEQAIPPTFINQTLTFLFGLERYCINKLSLPFGISILLYAQKSK
ncbi:MAG TPA: hypothetical protein V6C58_12055, partial [Allocoleopsis sp.]